jgi:hypothetical protein
MRGRASSCPVPTNCYFVLLPGIRLKNLRRIRFCAQLRETDVFISALRSWWHSQGNRFYGLIIYLIIGTGGKSNGEQ